MICSINEIKIEIYLNGGKFMKKTILTILFCGVLLLGMTGCESKLEKSKRELDEAKEDLEKTYEKYGWVEKENISTMIAKFNTEIMDGGINTPAYDDYLTVEDGSYWFGITENISYLLQPVEFTGDKDKDILDMSALYFHKENYNEEEAYKYVKCLIKANNYDLTEEEIDNLIKEAKEKSSKKETSNNGKGISVGFLEYDDRYIYQVIRLYK